MEVGDVVNLLFLAFLDYLTTWRCLVRGFRDLNPFISSFGLRVYPLLVFAGIALAYVLDVLASRLRSSVMPSRVLALLYVLAVVNNCFWLQS